MTDCYPSFDFLLQVYEDIGIEKIYYAYIKSVTNFFDRGDGGAVISSAYDIIQRGSSDTAYGVELVDGDIFIKFLDR